MRPVERDVGDLDAAEKQREEMQMRDQPLGGERRRLTAVIAEHDVREGDDAGRKYRERDRAAQHRIEPRDRADLGFHRVAGAVGGNEQRGDRECREAGRNDRRGQESHTLQASGRGHKAGPIFRG